MMQSEYDRQRDAWLRSQGYRVLRFWNNQVMQELPGVLAVIDEVLNVPSPTSGRGESKKEPAEGRVEPAKENSKGTSRDIENRLCGD